MKITRIEIKDYRGVKEFATDVGPAGLTVKGPNAKGKTSILNAISAALAARGIDPSDIRHGADSSEILISMDGLRVRRRISENGPSLAVTNKDGDRWSKPQSRLDEILGTSGIDALSFFLADPKKRRAMVLDAMALTVTRDQVVEWTGDAKLVDQMGSSGPALEVIDRYRKHFYERRTEANRVHKEKQRAWDAAAEAAPAVLPENDAGAVAELEAAGEAMKAISAREAAVTQIREGNEAARTRIAELRATADAAEASLPKTRRDYDGEVAEIQALIGKVEQQLVDLRRGLQIVKDEAREVSEKKATVFSRREAADDLERTIAATEVSAVTAEDRQQAEGRLTSARARAERAIAAAGGREIYARAQIAASEARAAEKAAEDLDKIVKRLTDEAPRQLAASGGIEGVALEGDRMTLDGTDLTSLSGAEQMRFAVRLAKRTNAKSKILIVDGLERLDAVRGVEFVKEATADNWQLFATRVADGELVVEAIEP